MPYVSCGTCIACRQGKTNCCSKIKVLGVHIDGGMQEIISVRSDLLIPSKNLSFNEMAIVEPLAIGAHAIRRAGLEKGETIVVIGCGPIGIGLMKQAQVIGAKVFALDINNERLQYARNEIEVAHAFNAMDDPRQRIAEITHGDMATAVFDAYEAWISSLDHGTEKLQEIKNAIPLESRMTTPAEIADTFLFVISERSSHTTGQFIFVDGGYVHLDRTLLPSK